MQLTERELCQVYGKPDPIAEDMDRNSRGSILNKYAGFLRSFKGRLTPDQYREKLSDHFGVTVSRRTITDFLNRKDIGYIATYGGKPVKSH